MPVSRLANFLQIYMKVHNHRWNCQVFFFVDFLPRTSPQALLSSFKHPNQMLTRGQEWASNVDIRARFKLLKVLHLAKVCAWNFIGRPKLLELRFYTDGYYRCKLHFERNAKDVRMPVTGFQLPVTSYQLPTTSYQLPRYPWLHRCIFACWRAHLMPPSKFAGCKLSDHYACKSQYIAHEF